MPKSVRIPAYYVNYDTGIAMVHDLENVAKSQQREGDTLLMIRVDLLPNSKPALDHWQFALIIVGAMLVTSIISISKCVIMALLQGVILMCILYIKLHCNVTCGEWPENDVKKRMRR